MAVFRRILALSDYSHGQFQEGILLNDRWFLLTVMLSVNCRLIFSSDFHTIGPVAQYVEGRILYCGRVGRI